EARRDRFGDRAAGAPFMVYFRDREGELRVRNYAVTPGDALEDTWLVADFPGGAYDLEAYGPNGFYRHFRGTRDGAEIEASLDTSGRGFESGQTTGVRVVLVNHCNQPCRVQVRDASYGQGEQELVIPPHETTFCLVSTIASHGWYDVVLEMPGSETFLRRWAGRVEWGEWSRTDPMIGS